MVTTTLNTIVNGSLFHLSWCGRICPCLEKEEDRKSRQALQQINAAGNRIVWYSRDNNENGVKKLWNAAAGGAGSLIGGLFGGKNKTAGPAGAGSSGLEQNGGTTPQEDGVVEAKLELRDNPETGKPELYVDPLPRPSGQTVGYKLQILLRRVDTIKNDPSSGKITLFAPPARTSMSSSGSNRHQQQQQPPKALLVLGLLKDINVPADVEDRETFVHNMSVMVEWERQRRAAITAAAGHDDDEIEDEEEEGGNFLTRKAQKAKHFAQRELELQNTKRDREKRKAKLVGASGGGLKYTAIAMANRASEES